MKTYPSHWLDFVFWPILKIVWEPFSRKNSHWWHHRKYEGVVQHPVIARAAQGAGDRGNTWRMFWESNFGWKQAVILEPVEYAGKFRAGFMYPRTHYGTETRVQYSIMSEGVYPNSNEKQLCSVLLSGQFAALLGPEEAKFFAIGESEEEIRLRVVGYATKSNLSRKIFLI